MNNIKPYTKYKPSGIAWLGDIPQHWEVVRLTGTCDLVRGNSSFKKDELLNEGKYVALQYGKTYKVNEVDENFQFYVNDEFYKASQIVNIGDVILVSTSETMQDLGHSVFYNRLDLGLIGGEQILLKPNTDDINGKYLYYSSKIFSKALRKYATGVKVYRFNVQDLKTIFTTVPPLPEQTAIANFLDYKTAKIDRFIFKKKQLIKLLNEQKAGIINDAVTKGLNPNTKTKPSGIEWLGDIPEHWEVRKLKYVAKIKTGRTPKIENSSVDYFENGDINWFTPGDFSEDGNLNISKRLVIQKAFDDKQIDLFPKNTVYLVSIGGTIGKVGISQNIGSSNQQINALIFNNLINSKFGYYLIKISKKQIDMLADFTTLPILNQTKTKEIIISFPNLSEQTTIVSHIEKETAIINKTIATIEKEIALVQEYRTAIIAEAVTGKIDVRSYEFSTIEEETYEDLEEELNIAAEEDAEFINQGAE